MEQVGLKLNNFETNIRKYFRELREEFRYFDVTLATEDHYQIETCVNNGSTCPDC